MKIVAYEDRYRDAAVRAMAQLQDYERGLSDDRPPGDAMADGHFDYLLRLSADKRGKVLLAIDEEAVRGFVVVVQEHEDDGDLHLHDTHRRYGVVTDLFVEESRRRRGIAGSLLEAAEAYCASQGLAVMRITALNANSAARRFYERSGYRPYELTYRKVLD